mgnify:FL=1
MDSPALSSSTSSLSLYDMDGLRTKLERKEELLQQAAQYGIDLMAANRDMAQSLEHTEKTYSKRIEVLDSL